MRTKILVFVYFNSLSAKKNKKINLRKKILAFVLCRAFFEILFI